MTFIKFCQPDRSVNIISRIRDAKPMNQGLVTEGAEEFSVHFKVQTDFGVHVGSDRVL
jgi:hypothetical protein